MSVEKLNKVGTFLARIVDSGVALSKAEKPMWTARLIVDKFYAEAEADLTYYKDNGIIEEATPQWVAWPEQETSPYMLLFNSSDDFSSDTAMRSYEQLVKATDWDGQEFATLDTAPIDNVILIRVDEESWEKDGQPQTAIRVQWIDHKDASPTRQLNKLDSEKVKGLGKIKMGGAKKAATPAPAAAPAPAAPAPAASSPPPTTPAPAPEAEAPAAPAVLTPPAGLDKGKAWDFVTANKGGNEDEVIVAAWTDAVGEVSEDNGNISDDDFTPAHWEKVVKIIIKDCALSA